MFTGLVEGVGTLTDVRAVGDARRVRIQTPLGGELAPGDSLGVNGVCLTVTAASPNEVQADIGPETLRVTTLGTLSSGQRVNLERPLLAGGRFGGHFVLGHVDGVGVVASIRPEADCHWMTISYPPDLARYFIRKGSVAVDGISLTVAALGEDAFDVQIVPFTWEHTTLGTSRPGERVNLECDMIGKYVLRAMELQHTR
jgi:riboflavin synthase